MLRSGNYVGNFGPKRDSSLLLQPKRLFCVSNLKILRSRELFLSDVCSFQQAKGRGSRNADTIELLCKGGHEERALGMLFHMDEASDCEDYWAILKACNKIKSLSFAQRLYACMIKHGLDLVTSLAEYLITTLVKCNGLKFARQVFQKLPYLSVISWTAIMDGLVDSGKNEEALELYRQLKHNQVKPNEYTFVVLLKACVNIQDLEKGKELHFDAQQAGLDYNSFVTSSLVVFYSNCGNVTDAEVVFSNGPLVDDIVLWTAVLSMYVEQGQGKKSMQLYRQMQYEGVVIDERCMVILLQACCVLNREMKMADLGLSLSDTSLSLEIGQGIHSDVKRNGFLRNAFVASTLISTYGKHSRIEKAENVFVLSPQESIVPANALLSAYVEQRLPEKALSFFCHMEKSGGNPDEHSIAIALQACCILAEQESGDKIMCLEIGKTVYMDSQMRGFGSDAVICSTVMSLYSTCGSAIGAENVFRKFSGYDPALWNVMLSAYSKDGQSAKALELCKKILDEGLILNDVTVIHILKICGETVSVSMCLKALDVILSDRTDFSPLLANTIVHAYGNCASVTNAECVFHGLVKPDVVSWNALIAGYGHEGNYITSFHSFLEMKNCGVEPDSYTFLSILAACSHAGRVRMGIEFFNYMYSQCMVTPDIKHYACMIDLLGRTGDINNAEYILRKLQMQDNLESWSSLLRSYSNIDLREDGIGIPTAGDFFQPLTQSCTWVY